MKHNRDAVVSIMTETSGATIERPCAGSHARVRKQLGEQSSRRFCSRPTNVRKTMARAGPIHPVYTAVARCVGRQLRMPRVLSGPDEGGICANTFSGPMDIELGTSKWHGVSRAVPKRWFRKCHPSCRLPRYCCAEKFLRLAAIEWEYQWGEFTILRGQGEWISSLLNHRKRESETFGAGTSFTLSFIHTRYK